MLSLSPPFPPLSPALNEWHQTARVGVGIYCHINEDALMNEQGWEWDTPLFFQILLLLMIIILNAIYIVKLSQSTLSL